MSHRVGPTAVAAIMAALVEEKSGLHHREIDRALFLDKVNERALAAGFESLLDYYYFLRYDPAGEEEIERLLEALVINETYFFRELAPLKLIVDHVVPALLAAGRRPRIWSAACSTGEEPLTLAMLLAARGRLGQVDLVASDLSERALARATSGEFSRRALRDPPADVPREHLQQRPDGTWTIARALIDAVDWRRVNLTDRAQVLAVGRCDVILCRNVLIYFDDPTVLRVVDSLGAVLAPRGHLFVGVSESLLRFATAFECLEHGGVFFYQRRPAEAS
jgi:chemotaxis protein methyltransferase CheR